MLLVCLSGGGGAGHVLCGGNGGAFMGPPLSIIGFGDLLLLKGLLVVFVVVEGGGGGGGVEFAPERNWSRKAETLFVDDEVEGGWVDEGDDETLACDMRAVLTAHIGPTLLAEDDTELEEIFKFELEVLRAGVGGGGGLTLGGLGGATVGRPLIINWNIYISY